MDVLANALGEVAYSLGLFAFLSVVAVCVTSIVLAAMGKEPRPLKAFAKVLRRHKRPKVIVHVETPVGTKELEAIKGKLKKAS